jgi:hypothetical protein
VTKAGWSGPDLPDKVNDSSRWKAQVDGTAVEVVERKLVDEVRTVTGSGSNAGEVKNCLDSVFRGTTGPRC